MAAFEQLPSIQRNLSGLSFQSGEPFAIQRTGQEQARNIAQSVPDLSSLQAFGVALMDLLKQYQQLGTRPFAEQELSAREAQANRVFETPPNLIGASPAIQERTRNAAIGALQPTISGAEQSQQTFSEQLRSFGDTLGLARGLIKDFEESESRKRDDARLSINNALTLVGGDAFSGLDPQEVNQLEKIAGYPKGYLSNITKTLKEREIELKNVQGQASLDNWVNLLGAGQIGLSQVPIQMRNQIVNRAAELGVRIISPTFAGKSAEAVQAFNSANALINLLGNQALQLTKTESVLGRIPQALALSAGAFLQNIPEATAYKATRDAFLSMLTRAAGEKGVLTTQDVLRIKKALPDFNDTREVAQKKINNLQSLFESIKTGGLEAYGGQSIQQKEKLIRVKELNSGRAGTLLESEFDPALYERL